MAVRAEPEEVIGRKGEKGCFIVPTQQAILVAEVSTVTHFLDRAYNSQYDAPTQAGDANVVVTKLADYLKSVNY